MAVSYTLRYRPASSSDPNPNPWTEVAGLTSTSRAVTGLTAGTEYEVEVVAVSDGGVVSSPVSGGRWTVCPQPAAPSGTPAGYRLSSGADENGAVDVSWSAVTGAASYTVSHRPTGGSTWTEVPGVSGASTRIGGLAGGATHEVRVAAVNADGDVSAVSTAATGVGAVIGTGGTVTRMPADGTATHVVHAFTTVGSASLSLARDRDVDVLVVAGGGGGGHGDDTVIDGGGGGAGGLVFKPSHAVEVGTVAVVVGAGGAGEASGSDSSFAGLVAKGGGRAGRRVSTRSGAAGGSGGGAAQVSGGASGGAATQGTQTGDSGVFGHGHGGADTTGTGSPGGGGGAGGPGGLPDGGAGLDRVTVSGTLYVFTDLFGTGIGDGGFFASGGAGQGGSAQPGGGQDGPDEDSSSNVAAAMANTGGGGAGANDDRDALGGAGGSGVVILRYPLTA
ncbi:MAG: hypothetical protein RLZZ353_170 [Actinomycetota bacterium]